MYICVRTSAQRMNHTHHQNRSKSSVSVSVNAITTRKVLNSFYLSLFCVNLFEREGFRMKQWGKEIAEKKDRNKKRKLSVKAISQAQFANSRG